MSIGATVVRSCESLQVQLSDELAVHCAEGIDYSMEIERVDSPFLWKTGSNHTLQIEAKHQIPSHGTGTSKIYSLPSEVNPKHGWRIVTISF